MTSVKWEPGQKIKEVEQKIITTALQNNNNNKTKTAKELGIAIRTIDNKLEKYRNNKEE